MAGEIYCPVYNLGVSGDTTREILKRLEFEYKQRIEDEKEFKENIKSVIRKTKRFSSKLIFTGLLPTDETKTNPIPWCPERSYKNKSIKKFDTIIESVCKKEKVHFISMKSFWETDYKKLLEDGCHPNSKGHEMIFKIVKDFLVEEKII